MAGEKTQYREKIAQLHSELVVKTQLVSEASDRLEKLKKQNNSLSIEMEAKLLEIGALNQIIEDLNKKRDLIISKVRLAEKEEAGQVDTMDTKIGIRDVKVKGLEQKLNVLYQKIIDAEIDLERLEKTKDEYAKLIIKSEEIKKSCEDKYIEAEQYLQEAKKSKDEAEKLLAEVRAKEEGFGKFKEEVYLYARRTNQFYEEKGMKPPIDLAKLV